MLRSKIVAYDERIGVLIESGIPFSTYSFNGVLYFTFPDEFSYIAAQDLFGIC